MVGFNNLPDRLKSMDQWVCWKGEPDPSRPGKIRKIPINPKTGGQAQSNNPETWADFQTALNASGRFSGIGFMFANNIFGVDIDGIQEEIESYRNGDEENILSEFIHSLGSYSEYSISGNGIHIICEGKLPEGGRRKKNVEMYDTGRFFICTGDSCSEYKNIVNCTESIKFLHEKYIGGGRAPEVFTREILPVDIENEKLIEIALKSKNGPAFQTLYSGSWEGLYHSQSEADLAFCNMLAFWTGADIEKMDAIFRSSGLMRDKWDRKTGQSTYGKKVLLRAQTDCREVFTPNALDDGYAIYIGNENSQKIKPKLKKYAMDDTGNADRFCDIFGNLLRYSHINKCWYCYDGRKWDEDNSGHVKKIADDMLIQMKKEFSLCSDEDEEKAFMKHLKYTRNSKGKTNFIKESEHRLSVHINDFDKKQTEFNVQNGVLNLRTGDLVPHTHDQFLSRISYVEYTNKIDCPGWIQFLNDIFAGNQDMIRYIQKAVGYSLTGSIKEQCMFITYGNGRNGKSTFIDVIAAIMGDYAANIQPESIMVKHGNGNANSDIARLKGARFVTTVEPNEGMRLNEGLIKQLTGGDKVTARFLYGKEFEFEPEFKLWISTNHKPIIRGRDDGIWRRLHLIPFTVQIPKEKVDKNLKYKLKKELTGILDWAVTGCLLWQREGLNPPAEVENAVKEYKSEMDVISAFLSECTDGVDFKDTKASEMYHAYVKWAEENNEYKMSNTKFGKELSERFERIKTNTGWYYRGVGLKDEYKSYSINFSD